MNSILIEHTNHDIYFSLAQENLVNAQNLYQEIIKSGLVFQIADRDMFSDGNPETSSWLNSKLFDLKKFVLPSIIFSALTAEAFINYYAISQGMSLKKIKKFTAKSYITEELPPDEMPQQYQKLYEERTTVKKWIEDKQGGIHISDTVIKWIEIPLQYTGKYIPSGLNGSIIYRLNELFQLRNKLVHHKAKVLNLDLNDPDLESAEDNNYVSSREAKNAVKVILESVKALKQIDNDIDISWLQE